MAETTPSPQPAPVGGGSSRRRTIIVAASVLAIVALVVVLAIGLANRGIDSTIQDALDAGERPAAPEVTLPVFAAADGVGPEGSEFTLSDLRGSIVVLNFWASWCEPCKIEAPILEGVARGYRQRGEPVVVLGINVKDPSSDARAFLADHEVSYPNLRDPGDTSERRYEILGLPETFIIDPSGKIAVKVPGQVTDGRQLTNGIEQLLAEAAR